MVCGMKQPNLRPKTFIDVINAWPSMTFLASEMGEPYETIRNWRRRDSIPSDKWHSLCRVAKRHSLRYIDADRLVQIAATRPAA